jgi:superfamily II DNA helicase RecQ
MTLQLKFFLIPMISMEAAEVELNRFLKSVRVVNIQREFVAQGDNSFWSLAVEYLGDIGRQSNEKGGAGRKSRIDYKEVLPPDMFAVYAKLREWRSEKASRDAVPVYTIFSNEQLAMIAENRITTKTALLKIDGIGDARVKKYGDEVIQVIAGHDSKDKQ